MKCMDILSAIKAQRDKIIDIMIEAMMDRDIEGTTCWTEIAYDLATGEHRILQYADCNSSSPLSDDEILIYRVSPTNRKWYEDYNSVEEIAGALDISKRDLIDTMEPWLISEGDSWEDVVDEDRELGAVYEWIEADAVPEIVAELKEAYVDWLQTDIYPVYEEEAERRYDGLLDEWTDHVKEEEAERRYEAAVLRGEVW